MDCSTPGFSAHHQLLEFTQTHVYPVGDVIQPSHPLSSPSPPTPNPSQHQGLFQWVNSSHGRKFVTNLDSILKSRDITLPTKVHLVKAMANLDSMLKRKNIILPTSSITQSYGFSSHIWMWETIKKAEHWRTDVFELWCWSKLLRVPWTARWSNPSILKEINPEY